MSLYQNELTSNHISSMESRKKNHSVSPGSMKYKKIGNYILLTTIGSGTFSTVKLGIHLPTQQKVAIKILDKDKIVDESDIKRISREIHILSKLRHPNIAQLYETLPSEHHIYIIMEHIEGHDLFQYIYSVTRLTELKASKFFRQLISCLEYIHKLGIVHRDIKPENILLNKKKTLLKLVDFGLSNSYQHGNLLKTACGSPCYAAPEMIRGKEYDGLYSDLWSCGVVLYCMLVGKLPFDDEDIKVLYHNIKSANYYMPSYLSIIAQDCLRKILTPNPKKRIRIEELKKHPFFLLGEKTPLLKGILVGVEDIPIEYDIVQKMKIIYFKDDEKISEEFICDNIAKNNHNNITAIYYLLLRKQDEELYNKCQSPLVNNQNIITEDSSKLNKNIITNQNKNLEIETNDDKDINNKEEDNNFDKNNNDDNNKDIKSDKMIKDVKKNNKFFNNIKKITFNSNNYQKENIGIKSNNIKKILYKNNILVEPNENSTSKINDNRFNVVVINNILTDNSPENKNLKTKISNNNVKKGNNTIACNNNNIFTINITSDKRTKSSKNNNNYTKMLNPNLIYKKFNNRNDKKISKNKKYLIDNKMLVNGNIKNNNISTNLYDNKNYSELNGNNLQKSPKFKKMDYQFSEVNQIEMKKNCLNKNFAVISRNDRHSVSIISPGDKTKYNMKCIFNDENNIFGGGDISTNGLSLGGVNKTFLNDKRNKFLITDTFVIKKNSRHRKKNIDSSSSNKGNKYMKKLKTFKKNYSNDFKEINKNNFNYLFLNNNINNNNSNNKHNISTISHKKKYNHILGYTLSNIFKEKFSLSLKSNNSNNSNNNSNLKEKNINLYNNINNNIIVSNISKNKHIKHTPSAKGVNKTKMKLSHSKSKDKNNCYMFKIASSNKNNENKNQIIKDKLTNYFTQNTAGNKINRNNSYSNKIGTLSKKSPKPTTINGNSKHTPMITPINYNKKNVIKRNKNNYFGLSVNFSKVVRKNISKEKNNNLMNLINSNNNEGKNMRRNIVNGNLVFSKTNYFDNRNNLNNDNKGNNVRSSSLNRFKNEYVKTVIMNNNYISNNN